MSSGTTRVKQRGAILLGCAGGLLIASGGVNKPVPVITIAVLAVPESMDAG